MWLVGVIDRQLKKLHVRWQLGLADHKNLLKLFCFAKLFMDEGKLWGGKFESLMLLMRFDLSLEFGSMSFGRGKLNDITSIITGFRMEYRAWWFFLHPNRLETCRIAHKITPQTEFVLFRWRTTRISHPYSHYSIPSILSFSTSVPLYWRWKILLCICYTSRSESSLR